MIVIYIIVLFGFVYFSFKLSKGDCFNLPFLLIAGYFVSAFCCLYNKKNWAVDLSFYTLIIIMVGILSFMIGSAVGDRIILKHTSNQLHTGNRCVDIYQIVHAGESYWKLLVVCLFDLAVIYFLYKDIVRIAGIRVVSWGNLFYNFRSNLADDSLNVGYSSFVNFGLRVTRPFAYLYAVILIGNCVDPTVTRRKKVRLFYGIPILLYAFQVILQGHRIPLIGLIIAFVFLIYYFKQYNCGWKMKLKVTTALRIIVFFSFICIGFYYVKFFIGKLQESNGVIYYITNYLGGSLQLLDMYLKDPMDNGHETFAAVVDSLKRFGLFTGVKTVVQHEYRYASTGIYIGNVYTGFRNYYNDYGVIGVCFFSAFLGFIFSNFYKHLRKIQNWTINGLFTLILYSSFLYSVVFHFFTDYFFALIGVGWTINIFIFYLCMQIVFNKRIGITKHKH